jgi:hypothetical protein
MTIKMNNLKKYKTNKINLKYLFIDKIALNTKLFLVNIIQEVLWRGQKMLTFLI